MLNKVMIIGNWGADPDIRTLHNGDRVANMRMATTEKWRDANGEKRK